MQCLKILSSIHLIFKGINQRNKWEPESKRLSEAKEIQDNVWLTKTNNSEEEKKKKRWLIEDNIFEQTEKIKTSKREFVCELKMSTYIAHVWMAAT